MKSSPFDQLFADTTVDVTDAWQYLRMVPRRLDEAVNAERSKHLCTVANHADYVDFHLRHYLCGLHETLHRVFVEIRSFLTRDESAAREAIPLILHQIRTTLIDNEWFELMPRFETAQRRVKAKFSL